MTFTITAELPLGTYRGAGADGRPEPLPSVARLHAALLCAAGFGPRAVPRGDLLAPSEADEVALRWLEDNPPDAVVIPELLVNRGRATAYRDDGTIKKSRTDLTIKKLAKNPDTAVAVNGRFAWSWRVSPPPPVQVALAALCPDVAYLGTTESPVRLVAGTGEVEPTHDLDPDADLFGVDGRDVEAPSAGRTARLVAAHDRATGPVPSVRADGFGTDERSWSTVPTRTALAVQRYVRRLAPAPSVPWSRVVLLPLSVAVPERDRVAWAVCAHRALIRLIGTGAPSLVTGTYLPGAPRPANRLALQLLDPSMPYASTAGDGHGSVLALLVPDDAQATDVQVLSEAVAGLTSLRGPGGRVARVTGEPTVASGAHFWCAPDPDQVRLWRTVPAAVPDTRGERSSDWTFTHAALLSVGFVWKDRLGRVAGRGEHYYRNLIDAASTAGAAVVDARVLRTVDVGRFVHRVNPHAVVRPYTAVVWLGDLAPLTAVAAIGQSRHLGGGLLVPYDVPRATTLDEVAGPHEGAAR